MVDAEFVSVRHSVHYSGDDVVLKKELGSSSIWVGSSQTSVCQSMQGVYG